MRKRLFRGAAPLGALVIALLLAGCNGEPMLGNISLGGFGLGPGLGEGGGIGPFGIMPAYGGGWGGGWGGDGGGWGGEDGGGDWQGGWGGEDH